MSGKGMPEGPLARHAARELGAKRVAELWQGVPARMARRRRRRLVSIAGAAALLLVGGAALRSHRTRDGIMLVTGTGDTAVRTLADGSRLEVGAASRVRVLTQGARAVRLALEAGQVALDVPPAPRRSFIVEVGSYEAQVRGTRFSVALSGEQDPEILVRVAEGRVEIRQRTTGVLVRSVTGGEDWAAPVADPRPPRLIPAPATQPAHEVSTSRAALEGLPSDAFLGRRGRQLTWGETPYRFVGLNAFSLTGCGPAEYVPTPAEARAFLAALRPSSIVRTLAFADHGLVAVEHVVEMARAHGHKVILVLSDGGGNCGDGMRKRSAWYAGEHRAAFLPWVRAVAARLAASPAVAMWEIAKEPRGVDAATLRAFYDEVGGELKRIAPRHLVASGSHGPFAYGGDAGYRLIHESPVIDVAGFQDFNMVWGAATSLAGALRVLDPLDKPLVIPGMGFQASPAGDPGRAGKTCLSWAVRAEALKAKLVATFATPVAGAVLWNWMPRSDGRCRYDVNPGDPALEVVRAFDP